MGRLSDKEPFSTFAARVAQAEAAFEAEAVHSITRQMSMDATMALKYLRIRHPARYAAGKVTREKLL
jgi:hypothetical protein